MPGTINKKELLAPIISDRWSEGIDHEPESEKLVKLISEMDFKYFNDSLCLKFGGDGDNGESLAYILDALIENGIIKIIFEE